MNIDSDLMDGDSLREPTQEELFVIYSSTPYCYSEIERIERAFVLGRQYERNQQKDDGK